MWRNAKQLVVLNRKAHAQQGFKHCRRHTLMIDSISKQRMFDGTTTQASIVLMAKQILTDSKHATYPSLNEASWRADARMSISMRLSCKVSRNVCFAMFLHTSGKMDNEASVRCACKKQPERPITVCDHQATSTTGDKWRSRWTAWDKQTKALMELLLRRCETNNIYLSRSPCLDTAIPCFV